MGLVARLFGKAPRKSQQPKMSQLQASTRDQTQRQLLTMALRDTLKRSGLVADCLALETVPGAAPGRGRGTHVQLVFKEWEPNLLSYVVALEHAFRSSLRRLDPLSPSWLLGISWRFEPDNPLTWPQLPAARPSGPAQRSPSATAAAASKVASLETLLQSGDAAFRNGGPADFSPTLPMQER